MGSINLHNYGWTLACLFSANDRVEITQNYIASMNCYHIISPRAKRSS